MKKTATRIALAAATTIVKTLTAGNESVTLSITGKNVSVTDGTPAARLLVTEALNIANPAPAPAGAPAPAKRKAAGTGRGANQAGKKRGPYKKRGEAAVTPSVEAEQPAEAQTEDAPAVEAEQTAEVEQPAEASAQ